MDEDERKGPITVDFGKIAKWIFIVVVLFAAMKVCSG